MILSIKLYFARNELLTLHREFLDCEDFYELMRKEFNRRVMERVFKNSRDEENARHVLMSMLRDLKRLEHRFDRQKRHCFALLALRGKRNPWVKI